MDKKLLLSSVVTCVITLAITTSSTGQNVGINTTGATPNSAAILDLSTGVTNMGFLAPQVALTSITVWAPVIGAAANGMLVYNTAAGVGNGVGYYYWANAQWNFLYNAGTATDWLLLGNSGTTAGTNFLGTKDAQDLVFKTNSTEDMRIQESTGYIGVGWASPQAELSLGKGEIGFCRADAADQTNYGRVGMDNGWGAYFSDNGYWNTGSSQYDYVNGGGYGGWAAGIKLLSGQLYFNNANGGTNPLTWNTRMFIAQSGNVGIGLNNTSPGYLLTVTGGAIGGNYGLTPNYASWATYGTGDGGAAIYNDNNAFKTLMLVGNNSAGGVRNVSVWDYLTINGNIKINNGSQASGYILTSDATGQGTWTPPTSILVYGNNAHSVSLTTLQGSTTTTSYTAIPGMTTTFTTLHTVVYVFASLTARLDRGTGSSAQFGQALENMALYVDGSPVAYTSAVITDYDNANGIVTSGTCTFAGYPVTIAPGSHTFALYWEPTLLWVAGGGWSVMCNPGVAGAADECILTVFD